MTWLLSADLHLTDRPRDAYRWGLFSWMAKQQAKYDVTATFILGDICDQKDKHSASLVNRLVDELVGLRPPIFILKGNHDFAADPSNPYFRFLNTIEGVRFIVEPTYLQDLEVVMIPHQPNQAALDEACSIVDGTMKAALGHQCITGAIAETGAALTGLTWPLVGQKQPRLGSYLGDQHRPQRLGNGVCYVGSPYHIRHGDNFTPRVLLLKDGKEQNLYFPAPHKWVLTVQHEDDILHNEDLHEGDQVKIVVELLREETVEWPEHRQRVLRACKEAGLEVFGCELKVRNGARRERIKLKQAKTPEEVLTSFCQYESVASNIKKVGMELIHCRPAQS